MIHFLVSFLKGDYLIKTFIDPGRKGVLFFGVSGNYS